MKTYFILIAFALLAAVFGQTFNQFPQNQFPQNGNFGNNINRMNNIQPNQFGGVGVPGGPGPMGPNGRPIVPGGPQQPNVDLNRFLGSHGIKMGRKGHGRRGHGRRGHGRRG